MGKRILYNSDARKGVLEGINLVANAVKVTLGAGGRTVIISDGNNPTRTTKDGVTVANSIILDDELLNAGAKMIKEVSAKTADDVGDGTTTVCVLMQELTTNGIKLIESGVNPMSLKKGMELAMKNIVTTLEKIAIPAETHHLKQIATVSSNNDEEIGAIVGEVFDKIGKHGIVSIEDSKTSDTTIEVSDGFHFMCGYLNEYFINNHYTNACELKNPYILIVEDKITSSAQILPILEAVARKQRALVIIADDFDHSVIGVALQNREVLPACFIKYNFMGETKNELMLDLCAVTGADLITEKKWKKLENVSFENLGECEKIIIEKGDTTIIKGKTKEDELSSRKKDAEVKIENAKNPFQKQLHERRLAKLNGAIAICRVGGMTEIERDEKRDRIDDAVKATKAAIEEGVVAGGGSALLKCISGLNLINNEPDVMMGVKLVKEAIDKPALQIYTNALLEPELKLSLVKQKVLVENYGYNAKTGNPGDMVEQGIIDPKKVVRVCVENAISASAQFLISQALIINDKKQ